MKFKLILFLESMILNELSQTQSETFLGQNPNLPILLLPKFLQTKLGLNIYYRLDITLVFKILLYYEGARIQRIVMASIRIKIELIE